MLAVQGMQLIHPSIHLILNCGTYVYLPQVLFAAPKRPCFIYLLKNKYSDLFHALMMCHAPHRLPPPFHGVFGWIDKSHLKAVVATEIHGTLLTYCVPISRYYWVINKIWLCPISRYYWVINFTSKIDMTFLKSLHFKKY